MSWCFRFPMPLGAGTARMQVAIQDARMSASKRGCQVLRNQSKTARGSVGVRTPMGTVPTVTSRPRLRLCLRITGTHHAHPMKHRDICGRLGRTAWYIATQPARPALAQPMSQRVSPPHHSASLGACRFGTMTISAVVTISGAAFSSAKRMLSAVMPRAKRIYRSPTEVPMLAFLVSALTQPLRRLRRKLISW